MSERFFRSKAAYSYFDVGTLPEGELKQVILDDAATGGREYGLEIVEIVHNGPAAVPVYGVYNHNQEKWQAVLNELGLNGDVSDNPDLVEQAAKLAEVAAAHANEVAEAAVAAVAEGQGDRSSRRR